MEWPSVRPKKGTNTWTARNHNWEIPSNSILSLFHMHRRGVDPTKFLMRNRKGNRRGLSYLKTIQQSMKLKTIISLKVLLWISLLLPFACINTHETFSTPTTSLEYHFQPLFLSLFLLQTQREKREKGRDKGSKCQQLLEMKVRNRGFWLGEFFKLPNKPIQFSFSFSHSLPRNWSSLL